MVMRKLTGYIKNVINNCEVQFVGKTVHGNAEGEYTLIIDPKTFVELLKAEHEVCKIVRIEGNPTKSTDKISIIMSASDKRTAILEMNAERLIDFGEGISPTRIDTTKIYPEDFKNIISLFKEKGTILITIQHVSDIPKNNLKKDLKDKQIILILL